LEPRAAYDQRLTAAKAQAAALDARAARLANFRGVVFFSVVGLVIATLWNAWPGVAWLGPLLLFAGYIGLAVVHDRVLTAESRAKMLVLLNERGLARLHGQWRLFEGKGDRFADASHPYTPDLDVFGQGSLFQLLDETATRAGEEKLASWMKAPSQRPAVLERQGAVKELAPLIDFRQELVAQGRLAVKNKADAGKFIEWAEAPPFLTAFRWARPLAWILPAATLALFLLTQNGVTPRWAWWPSLVVQVAVMLSARRAMRDYHERISMGEMGFVRFERTFATVEAQAVTHPLLKRLRAGLDTAGATVSQRFQRFERLFGFADLRSSGQMHAVIDALLLWDVHWMFRIEAWRQENGPKIRGWFEALAELEALSSLAGYAFDRPDHAFPTVSETGPRFVARALGHPLLDAPVRNDVSLAAAGTAWVITGSNMSGKTTLLRSMGLNAVMALAGMPACAEALELSELSVVTSMRVKDSLERGVSYFYAEVQRMKSVLDAAAKAPGRTLFLLDELLMGTNTRERQIASRELLKLLLDTGAAGAVTTHDLALTELAAGAGHQVVNVHFRDVLVDGKMTFDYRLRDGVVETTNALRVLREAGIPIREDRQ
jgi:hypothetical protein